MRYMFCNKCNNMFTNDLLRDLLDEHPCPVLGCPGELSEIDELMVPIISMLHTNGYRTEYCCSGHIISENDNIYIKFIPLLGGKSHGFELIDELSKYFVLSQEPTFQSAVIKADMIECTISKKLMGLKGYDKMKKILELNELLFKWVSELPKQNPEEYVRYRED